MVQGEYPNGGLLAINICYSTEEVEQWWSRPVNPGVNPDEEPDLFTSARHRIGEAIAAWEKASGQLNLLETTHVIDTETNPQSDRSTADDRSADESHGIQLTGVENPVGQNGCSGLVDPNSIGLSEEPPTAPTEVVTLDDRDRRVEALWQEFKQAADAANNALKTAAQKYCALGIELNQRREEFKRGEWLPWLRSCGIEERHAQAIDANCSALRGDTRQPVGFVDRGGVSRCPKKSCLPSPQIRTPLRKCGSNTIGRLSREALSATAQGCIHTLSRSPALQSTLILWMPQWIGYG